MRLICAMLIVALAASGEAVAQTDPFRRGFDAVPLKLTPTFNSGLILEGAELPLKGSYSFQAVLDFNFSIMGLTLGNQRLGNLIPFRGDLHLMGTYQVHPRVELSADLPITFYQLTDFALLTEQGFPQASPHPVGLGDLRLLGRFQALTQKTFLLGVTGVVEVRLPIGDGFSFLGDQGLVFSPRAAVERQLGPFRILGNIGWRLRTAYGQFLNLYVGQEFIAGAGLGINLPDVARFTRNQVLGELNISTPAEAPFTVSSGTSLKTPLELMVGLRSYYNERWAGQVAFASGLANPPGYGRESFRLVVSLRYAFEPEPDRDGDGIPDRIDQCPDQPEDFDGYQDEDGCPEPDPDSDGDGVPDRVDGCKDQPGPADYDGCPDRDGDQIPDNVDKCPDEPGPAETEGCPVPKEEEVVLESDRIRIKGNILFETGQAIIQRQSYPMLDDVAKVLQANPEVGPVLIEGHTDDRGSRPYNLDLSNRRAKAVADYLVLQGVDRKRLRTAGFGFDRPVSTNDTPLGRAKNRRTEFRLVEEDGEPKKPGKTEKAPAPAPAPSPAAAAAPAPASAAPAAPAKGSAAPAPPPKPRPPGDGGTPR